MSWATNWGKNPGRARRYDVEVLHAGVANGRLLLTVRRGDGRMLLLRLEGDDAAGVVAAARRVRDG